MTPFLPASFDSQAARDLARTGANAGFVEYLGETCGIYLTNISRGNIAFEHDEPVESASTS